MGKRLALLSEPVMAGDAGCLFQTCCIASIGEIPLLAFCERTMVIRDPTDPPDRHHMWPGAESANLVGTDAPGTYRGRTLRSRHLPERDPDLAGI